MADQHSPWKLGAALEALKVIAIVLTALSVYYAYVGIRETHRWNRNHYTITMLAETNKQLDLIRDDLRRGFPELFDESHARPLSEADAANLFNACAQPAPTPVQGGREFTCNDRKVAAYDLNYLEYIGAAYVYQVGDRELIDKSFGGLLLSDHTFFRKFIEHIQKARNGVAPWGLLTEAVSHLEKKRIKIDHDPPITGVSQDNSG